MKVFASRLLAAAVLTLTACQAAPPVPTQTPQPNPVQTVDDPTSPPTATIPTTEIAQPITPTSEPTAEPTATAVLVAATPTAPSSPTSVPEPTADRAKARLAIRDRVAQAAARMNGEDPSERRDIATDLREALREYVQNIASVEALASNPVNRDDLATILTLNPPATDGSIASPDRPAIDRITLRSGDVVVLVEYQTPGLPLFGAGLVNGNVSIATLPLIASLDPSTKIHFDRAIDLTGDGANDLVLTGTTQGASDAIIDLAFIAWAEAGPQEIFSTTISQWAGPAEWRLVSNGSGQDLVITCLAFGPFDHKLLAHPRLTKTYRWDGQTFAVAAAELAPPVSPRDSFNRAEVAFRHGDLMAAISRYRQVPRLAQPSPDEDTQTDWAALAALRIGQSLALSGDLTGARQSLAIAEAAGGTIGELARAFQAPLDQPDGVVRGFAALQATDLGERLSNNTAGNIGFSVDPTGLTWPGLAIHAFLQAHPEVANESPGDLRAALEKDGLTITALTEADLSGTGHQAILALLPVGDRVSAWVFPRDGNHPALTLVDHPDGGFAQIAGLEPGPRPNQQLIVLINSDSALPSESRLGQEDGQLAFFAPDHSVIGPALSLPNGQCNIADGLKP